MTYWSFNVTTAGVDPYDDAFERSMSLGGLGDAKVEFLNRLVTFSLERPFDDVSKAISGVCRNVKQAGGRVLGIGPDRLISLSEMGHVPGLSWSTVHALANGADDSFPLPSERLGADRPLWDWTNVAEWLARRDYIDVYHARFAALIRDENGLHVRGTTRVQRT